ncbi:MAG: SPASM domain-containing protein [Planctomycetota bacterium]|nr:SPASM domain-containing protein [Planctomycetota bacterium]
MRKAIRAIFCGLSYVLGRTRTVAGPLRVWVEPSTECGGGCGFCPVGLGLVPTGMWMSAETFLHVASGLPENCDVNLHHRGEPLTHPDAPAMAGALAAAGHRVRINTSGMRLDPETRARLLESRAHVISLSFDGPGRGRYSRLRPGCNYETVMANFRAMLAERRGRLPRLEVETILFPDPDMADPSRTAVQIRAAFAPFRPDAVILRPPHSWDGSIGPCGGASGTDGPLRANGPPAGGGPFVERPSSGRTPAESRFRRCCHHLWTTLVVFADGTVTVCPQDYSGRLAIGSVRDNVLGDIWNGPRMRELRAMHASGRIAGLDPCGSCPVPSTGDRAGLVRRLADWLFPGRTQRPIPSWPPMSPKKAARFEAIRSALPPLGRWLDAAVGAGAIAAALRDGRRWTYIEADPAARSAASALLRREVLPEERLDGLPDASFDGVLLSDRLEHVKDDAGLLRRCARLLAPGGCMIVTVPVAGRFLYRLRRALGTNDAALGHVREGYTAAGLAALLDAAGLRVDATRLFAGPAAEIADALMVAAARALELRTGLPCGTSPRTGPLPAAYIAAATASDSGPSVKILRYVAPTLFAVIRFFDRPLERLWGHGLLIVAKKP